MGKNRRLWQISGRLVLGFILFPLVFSEVRAEDLLLSGSSMLLPLDRIWATAYVRLHPGVRILTSGPGSGAGFYAAISGNSSIGASDVYLTEKELRKIGNVVLIPVALEGTIPIVNLPIHRPFVLKMTGSILAGLFLGRIRFWDDPALATLNPGLPLPHLPVRVFRRSDSSGTTFVLTDYLGRTSPAWRDRVGREALPDWPVFDGASGVFGSSAMASAVRTHPGAIGYVGLGWVRGARLAPVALENMDGHFVAGTVRSISEAGRAAFSAPDFPAGFNRSIVWDLPGRAVYPAASVEFLMINTNLPGQTMRRVRKILDWILTDGQNPQYTIDHGFVPLPRAPRNPRLGRLLEELLPGNTYRPVSAG